MKFVVFTEDAYKCIKPLGDGLVKTLREEGHTVDVWYDGIYWLYSLNLLKVLIADFYRVYLNIKSKNRKKYIYRFWGIFNFFNKKRRKIIEDCDCIIIVQHCPLSFSEMPRIEYLRRQYPQKVIVNYDFHYLPNQGWYKRILNKPLHFGLERYDWYLPVGVVTEYAIPKEIPQIYTCIGMDIKENNLFPDQKEFKVLLDFERNGYDKEREIIIDVLNELEIPYVTLQGRYTTDEIRSIYRSSSVYFISFRESFGLPISELQLCGSYIFTPYKEWAPAYFLDKDIYSNGVGNLGTNFVVYDNNKEILKRELIRIRSSFDSSVVCKKFKDEYSNYYSINRKALREFINKLENGTITSQTHLSFKEYNKYISLEDNVELR